MQGRDDNRIWPPFSHVLHLLFLILLLIFIHAQRVIFHFIFQHFVHHPRMDVPWPPLPAPVPTVIVIADTSPQRQSAFLTEFAASRNACPARFFVFSVLLLNTLPPVMSHLHLRTVQVCLGATQPGAAMLLGRKLLPDIAAHFHCHGLRQRGSHFIHQAQIHAIDPVQLFTDLFRILWCIFAVRVPLLVRYRWQFSAHPIGTHHSILTIDLLVTGLHLLRVEIVQLQRLFQDVQMLFPPRPCQSFFDLLFHCAYNLGPETLPTTWHSVPLSRSSG